MPRRFINALQVELPEEPGAVDSVLVSRGLLAEPASPATLVAGAVPTTTLLYADLVFLPAGVTVSNMVTAVSVAGAGTAPTLIKMGVYSVPGTFIIGTANVATDAMWLSTGQKVVPLTTPWTVLVAGSYYLVFLINGTFASTNIQLAQWNIGNVAGAGVGLVQYGSSPRMFARASGIVSDLGAAVTWIDGPRAHYIACG